MDKSWKQIVELINKGKRDESFLLTRELIWTDCKKMIISKYGSRLEKGDEISVFWYAFTYFYENADSNKFDYQNEKATESYFKSGCNYIAKNYLKIYNEPKVKVDSETVEYINSLFQSNELDMEISEDESQYILDNLIKVFRLIDFNEERKFIFLIKTFNKRVSTNKLRINNEKIHKILYPFYEFKISGINKMNQYFKQRLFKMFKNMKQNAK